MIVASLGMVAALVPLHGVFVGHGTFVLLGGIAFGAAVYAVLAALLGIVRPRLAADEFRRLLRRRSVRAAGV